MASHSCDPKSPLILKDGCARCSEHAVEPWFTVDRDRVRELVLMTLRWEGNGGSPSGRLPESDAERRACQSISDHLNAVRAMFGLGTRGDVVERLSGPAMSMVDPATFRP